jgi:hypothetical protein
MAADRWLRDGVPSNSMHSSTPLRTTIPISIVDQGVTLPAA